MTKHIGSGILWMLVAALLFSSMDTVAKSLTAYLPPAQIAWGRFFFHVVIVTLFFRLSPKKLLHTKTLPIQAIRSLLQLLTTLLFFIGIKTTDLTSAAAITLTSPVIVVALSMLILRERLSRKQWAGIAAAIVGAFLVAQPKGYSLQEGHIYILGAAFSHATYQVLTRSVRKTDRESVSLFYSAAIGAFLTTAYVPMIWVEPDSRSWVLLILLGILGVGSHLAVIKAFSLAPASTVAPFSYTSLIWALVFSYTLFNTLPDLLICLGAILIVLSGLYLFSLTKQKH